MTRVLIAGVSTRGFAESAARAGYDVLAVDGFGDLDLRARAQSVSVARSAGRFSIRAAVAAARRLSTFPRYCRSITGPASMSVSTAAEAGVMPNSQRMLSAHFRAQPALVAIMVV